MRRVFILPLIAVALLTVSCQPPKTLEYVYPAWGFRISFVAAPKVTEKPAEPDGLPHSVLMETDSGGRDFAVDVSDATATDIDQVTDTLVPLMLKQVPGGTADIRTYAATFEGLLGRQFDIEKNGKPDLRVRVFLAGDRLYALVAKSVFGVDDPAVDQFLYSFHVLPDAATNGAAAVNAAPTTNSIDK
jgi:hypothetical protein